MAGAAISPIRVINVTIDRSVVNAALASSHVSFLLRRVWYSVKTGIKAEDMEPSARSSRNRLGIR